MAWTAPATWVASADVTAAQFNEQIRDNFNETAPGVASAAGRLIVTDALNSIAERVPGQDFETASESTASTTYTDLATVGPSVSVATGTEALVIISAVLWNATAGSRAITAYAVSGVTTDAANDTRALMNNCGDGSNDLGRFSVVNLHTGLTAGTNVFTMKYRASANTASFDNRTITVIPF